MPRRARVVIPGYPHHVTQRGNRRQQVFFSEQDYQAYRRMLLELKDPAGVQVWAYCLMQNHVHLVVCPERQESLATLFGQVHRRLARRVNVTHEWTGHLWQERFHSVVMDEAHLMAAVRYVELNPVRAGLCERAEDWRWSSAAAYLHGSRDELLHMAPMRDRIRNWQAYLDQDSDERTIKSLRKGTSTGRPVGDGAFIRKLERVSGQRLARRRPGPIRKIRHN